MILDMALDGHAIRDIADVIGVHPVIVHLVLTCHCVLGRIDRPRHRSDSRVAEAFRALANGEEPRAIAARNGWTRHRLGSITYAARQCGVEIQSPPTLSDAVRAILDRGEALDARALSIAYGTSRQVVHSTATRIRRNG